MVYCKIELRCPLFLDCANNATRRQDDVFILHWPAVLHSGGLESLFGNQKEHDVTVIHKGDRVTFLCSYSLGGSCSNLATCGHQQGGARTGDPCRRHHMVQGQHPHGKAGALYEGQQRVGASFDL